MTVRRNLPLALVLCTGLLLAACGSDAGDGGGGPAVATAPSVLLKADYPDALSILDSKEKQEGDQVTVFGRVRDIAKGFAAFTLIDDELEYCGRGREQCGCKTPWDYCCNQKEVQIAASMPVEVRDAAGNPVEADDLPLRLLDLVALKGTLAKTESGGLMLVVKDGWFRRERPTLGDDLLWP